MVDFVYIQIPISFSSRSKDKAVRINQKARKKEDGEELLE